MTEKSLANLGTSSVDLQQLHVWSDAWVGDEGWQRAADDLKRQRLIRGFGISVNRWEPANVIKALRTGLVDAVQVVYNIFDQNPEDELFPVCRELDIAVIARVPFDEGSLTGNAHERQPMARGRLAKHLFHARKSRRNARASGAAQAMSCRSGMDLPELALRFILAEPTVSTVIPGMRKARTLSGTSRRATVELPPAAKSAARARWDRTHVIPDAALLSVHGIE